MHSSKHMFTVGVDLTQSGKARVKRAFFILTENSMDCVENEEPLF